MRKLPRWRLWVIPCSLLVFACTEALSSGGPTVTSVMLKPSQASGGSGGTSTGTVTLSALAPAGGTLVALSSSNSALAAVQPSVTVPAGQTSATFTVWTNADYRRYSGLSFAPLISASANASTQSATLTVTAQRLPADIQNDTADRHGTVCGGSFPATSGDKGILYTCFAGPNIGTAGTCTFSAECLVAGCLTQPSNVFNFTFSDACATGAPYPVSVNPAVVVGASGATGTAERYQAAPSGGTDAKLSSSSIAVMVPYDAPIASGKPSATFTVTNTDVTAAVFANITVDLDTILSHFEEHQLGSTWYAVLPSGNCQPTTCAAHGFNCGTISDGCGNTLNCGTCTAPQICGGGGSVNVCGCTPMTCASQGFGCGSVPDGCGGTLNCGTCPSGQFCDIYHQCFPGCATCQSMGFDCGTASDGCGGTLRCGNCSHHQNCINNVCGGH